MLYQDENGENSQKSSDGNDEMMMEFDMDEDSFEDNSAEEDSENEADAQETSTAN